MANYKTPGVYVEEISTLPASVAPVATAIPAFIGYTEKRVRKGIVLSLNKPTRITSLLEYQEIFGGPFSEAYTVTLAGTLAATTITATLATQSPYILYYQVRQYFANGGGPCYIVSVGNYVATGPSASDIDVVELVNGINALEQEDE